MRIAYALLEQELQESVTALNVKLHVTPTPPPPPPYIYISTLSHLPINQLFKPFQSAYRPVYSTETALLKGMDDRLRSLDHGNVSVLTLLDFSDAFDTVDHTILLQHLDVSLA